MHQVAARWKAPDTGRIMSRFEPMELRADPRTVDVINLFVCVCVFVFLFACLVSWLVGLLVGSLCVLLIN